MSYYNNVGYYPNQYMNPQFNQQPYINQQVQQAPQGLNGKIVDTVDMVKAMEVPIGGYGVFPKADFSEVYVKSWNSNGTTNVITFKPFFEEPTEIRENNEIIERIKILEEKIDKFLSSSVEKEKDISRKDDF